MHALPVFIAAFVVQTCLRAQTPVLSGPSLGAVFDSQSRALRMVSGVPGAALLDLPVSSAVGIARAWVSPRGAVALAVGKDGRPALVRWGVRENAAVLERALRDPSAAALSGDTAAIVSPEGLQIWSGLGSTPELRYEAAAESLGGPPVQVAVSADGVRAAVLLRSGEVIEIAGAVQRAAANAKEIAYAGSSLVVLDGDGRVAMAGGPQTAAGVFDPDSVLAGFAGGAVIAARATGRISVLTTAGEIIADTIGECKFTTAQVVDQGGLILLAGAENGGCLVDAGRGELSVQLMGASL